MAIKNIDSFIKTQLTLIAGSVIDFAVTIALVQGFHCWYVAASTTGNICGFIIQFVLCREWVFKTGSDGVISQIIRFLIVWAGSLGLSALGIYCFTHFSGINYILSKILTSILLGLTYNYLLLKKFVFK